VTHQPLTVGCRCGRGRTALGAMEGLEFIGLYAARPSQLAIFKLIAAGLEVVVGVGRKEKLVVPDAGRGPGPRHFDPPQDRVGGTDFDRWCGTNSDARGVGTAKRRPG